MARCWWLLLCVLGMLSAACTIPIDAEDLGARPTTTTLLPQSSTPTTQPPGDNTPLDPGNSLGNDEDDTTPGAPRDELPGGPPGAEALAQLPGLLAVTDRPVLVLLEPDGTLAETLDDPIAGFASQPTWSNDGSWLAWASVGDPATNAAELRHALVVREVTATPESVVRVPSGATAPIYLQWRDDDEQIAVLQNGGTGLQLSTSSTSDWLTGRRPAPAAEGVPLFLSWRPSRPGLAVHSNGQVVLDGATVLDGTAESFTAPGWATPETLVAALPDALVTVTLPTGGGDPVVTRLASLAGPTQFVVSPDGTKVAYLAPDNDIRAVAFQAADSTPVQTLRVLDLASGDEQFVVEGQALAWEWSPDGARLAYLAPAHPDANGGDGARGGDGAVGVRWYFWQNGQTIGATTAHVPSVIARRSYLPFFAQYAQSHTGWSPDGAAFAFAGTVEDTAGIFVHVLGVTPASVRIADGDYVTWSPVDAPAGFGTSPA